MTTKIYVLCEPDGEIRYVGKTISTLEYRFKQHLFDARNKQKNYRCNWIRSVMENGYLPVIRLIGEFEGDGVKEEIAWIAYGKQEGWNLVNGTDGGENPPSRKGISGWNKGLKMSAEYCQKLSEAHVGVRLSKKHSQKISEGHKGLHRSKEFCLVISNARKKYWKKLREMGLNRMLPETRKKISLALKGRTHSKESVAKWRMAVIGQKRSLESRRKMSESRKEYCRKCKELEALQKAS